MKRQILALLGASLVLLPVATVALACNEGSYLPRPNGRGDFTARNANTYRSETNGMVTWPQWRVVSSDGELNCRATPNGRVTRVYEARRDRIQAELRGGNAIRLSDGAPWMLTRQGCYVRANARYIQPI